MRHKDNTLTCGACKLRSHSLDEVCYYDANGHPYTTEQEIEQNSNNPDALLHILCTECAERKFESSRKSMIYCDRCNKDFHYPQEINYYDDEGNKVTEGAYYILCNKCVEHALEQPPVSIFVTDEMSEMREGVTPYKKREGKE